MFLCHFVLLVVLCCFGRREWYDCMSTNLMLRLCNLETRVVLVVVLIHTTMFLLHRKLNVALHRFPTELFSLYEIFG